MIEARTSQLPVWSNYIKARNTTTFGSDSDECEKSSSSSEEDKELENQEEETWWYLFKEGCLLLWDGLYFFDFDSSHIARWRGAPI